MRVLIPVVTLLLAASTSHAEETKDWNIGVSVEQRELAQPFFDSGNHFFERSMYAKALTEYEKAIAHRDHPAIRYNMAVCLINLGRPIDAYENLTASLKHGDAPLAQGLYKEGQTFLKLLLGQIAEVQIVTAEVGARVSLNGKELFVGPGEVTLMVKPEEQVVTTIKEGKKVDNQRFIPQTSKTNRIQVVLVSANLVLEQRWDNWKPWAVAGSGAALLATAVPLFLFSRDNMSEYDADVARLCPSGCSELPSATSKLKSRAEFQDIGYLSLAVTGSALLSTGIVLLLLNRPQRVEDEPTGHILSERHVSIAPSFAHGWTGNYSFRF